MTSPNRRPGFTVPQVAILMAVLLLLGSVALYQKKSLVSDTASSKPTDSPSPVAINKTPLPTILVTASPASTPTAAPVTPAPTPDPFSGWQPYTNATAGFSLRYPSDTTLTVGGDIPEGGGGHKGTFELNVQLAKVADLPEDASHGADKKTAQTEESLLSQGLVGRKGSSYFDSMVKKTSDGKPVESFAMYAMHGSDTMYFMRHIVFYKNGYQVFLTFTTSAAGYQAIPQELPQYFETATQYCANTQSAPSCVNVAYLWKGADGKVGNMTDSINGFFTTVSTGHGKTVSQAWYDEYEKIVQSMAI